MLTDYNHQDALRLQQARLARFKTFVITDFHISIVNDCLILQGIEPQTAIAETNSLLCQASIILGTSKLQILDTDSNLVFAAELKSEQTHKSEEVMTAATAARSVEFDMSASATTPVTISWNRIAAITGEKEKELRDRLQVMGVPFYWSDDSWAVGHDVASQLIIRFRAEQGRKEAEMLLASEPAANGHQSPVPSPQSPETNGTKPTKPKAEKPEFQPLKRGVTPTLEKYLSFVANDESRQSEILNDIATETSKGKRHLTKILSSYPEDMEKPTRGEFQVAAKKLLNKRSKAQSETETPTQEEVAATEGEE
ncbi:hypothetical protein I8748_32245 [Nostoc sp. CENA67]|uniref:Uncharacterized protein n=1 Tax=Amazonocrinis nigriterrae CENA67 TaxID=2794033 RepID=A0A8J7HVT1_9NOST|nr:hypothetical protein [Amazonocrinis nigriterrae]MBH8566771.1 hypothetical protein [Amazonocrinis nigriterrae CENA67]